MILHQIEALVKVGVNEVVLAVNYKPELMKKQLEEDLGNVCADKKKNFNFYKSPFSFFFFCSWE